MSLKDENIEWTERSLELPSSNFKPLVLSAQQRNEMTKLLQKDWSEDVETE